MCEMRPGSRGDNKIQRGLTDKRSDKQDMSKAAMSLTVPFDPSTTMNCHSVYSGQNPGKESVRRANDLSDVVQSLKLAL